MMYHTRFLLLQRMSTDDLHSQVKFFTKAGASLFLHTAKEIRDVSLKESSAEGLSEQVSDAIGIAGAGVGASVGAVLSGPVGIASGAKLGKIAGGFVNKGISGILQVSILQIKRVLKRFGFGNLFNEDFEKY